MLVDILIIIFAISALYRGREIGFVRQLGSNIGFFGGLFLGAWLEPHIISHIQGTTNRGLVAVIITLGMAFAGLIAGEYAGLRLKRQVATKKVNALDMRLGSALNVVALLLSSWVIAAIIGALPLPSIQASIHNSRIVSALNSVLPPAPTILTDLGNLIDPNGFPQVFVGNEPSPNTSVNLPSLGELQTAVSRDRASVVKLEGQGCGGIVDGSGFIVGPGYVATNAHVVAGIRHPYVQDKNGTHKGQVIYFDPNLDFAILQVDGLKGQPLDLSSTTAVRGQAAAVMGYPGGGPFTAGPAAVLDKFTASGRNIYGRGTTARGVYELQATVIPGNSGGPLVAADGSVIGVVFAESTTYQHVGYALTMPPIIKAIQQATAAPHAVSTGQCAE